MSNKKVVFISGASSGIGKAIAARFAKGGWNAAVTCSGACSFGNLTETVQYFTDLGSECLPFCCDAADAAAVEDVMNTVLEHFGHIDCLVNNAGIDHIGLLQDMSVAEWDRLIQVNLSGCFYTSRLVIPAMLQNHNGHIINISSVWGVCGASCEVAYSASKSGINGFTKALAKELAPSGISVNAIACGVIDTRMNSCFSPEEMDSIREDIPAGRLGTPAEVAELVFTIACQSTYLTGQVITMDGGYI